MADVKHAELSEGARKTAAEALQAQLVDLLDLVLVSKQLHWNVVGPHFRSVHLQLDELEGTVRSRADEVAERAATLGVPPDGRASTIAFESSIATVAEGWQEDSAAVDAVVAALDTAIAKGRERIAAVAEVDPVTEDLFIGLVGELEKHHWMFRMKSGRTDH
ncbi:DNA starvation/stationary phase protection protein [Streptomyces sp. B-S-A8]|uniref:DNA starvation/stationary phase protection protein n=1 Tax=Streptomyces solicavernae TaxID=3043614 RepID=A0ABT6RTS0_9ACTN|nr:DNA starvation/stationary phase protection protein [Streptomyces sp. B-S-A8]MDI3387830.1 DNA starvation/stationary phase protection protein [Streptomyces sp. B-S-A8]